MIRLFSILVLVIAALPAVAQIKVGPGKHHLVTKTGKPFLWLGDTAWELFHRLTREEATAYLQNRAEKGFNVIQAVVLAELDGLNTPNAYGDKPLLGNDPSKPNEAYFKHVDYVVNEANKRGLLVALLPSWGDKWKKDSWGTGPEIFTPANAFKYAQWLARRYAKKDIVWVIGGDRHLETDTEFTINRSMAEGIKSGDPTHLLTFHPAGGRSSYDYFAADNWIDFHMSQTGHRAASPCYKTNLKAYALKNQKPHLNGEPNYEDHPNDFRPAEKGWMDDVDTRQAAYWNMLSGGAGHTYGNHNIWQMYATARVPVNNARTHWRVAMNQPGAFQVGFMRRMLEKRNWQTLVPSQEIIMGDNPEGVDYRVAAISTDKDLLMVYIPTGKKTQLNTSLLPALILRGWWFNPRDGHCISLGEFSNTGQLEFIPTSVGRGSDWVLVLDDAAKNWKEPNAF